MHILIKMVVVRSLVFMVSEIEVFNQTDMAEKTLEKEESFCLLHTVCIIHNTTDDHF